MSKPKTILITGGTGKIGKQLLEHFSKKGLQVVFTSRSTDKIEFMTKTYKNVIGIKIDLQRENSTPELLEKLQERDLHINYLVNNARDLDALKLKEDGSISREAWLKEYTIDVISPYELSLAFSKTPHLEKVINIASIYGMVAFNHHLYEEPFNPVLQYACAKAALIQLTKCMAVYFADKKIPVNCISYGGIEGRVDENFLQKYATLCPEKRMLTEKETVGAVEFLLSENSTSITGQNIVVDGGWTIW